MYDNATGDAVDPQTNSVRGNRCLCLCEQDGDEKRHGEKNVALEQALSEERALCYHFGRGSE